MHNQVLLSVLQVQLNVVLVALVALVSVQLTSTDELQDTPVVSVTTPIGQDGTVPDMQIQLPDVQVQS